MLEAVRWSGFCSPAAAAQMAARPCRASSLVSSATLCSLGSKPLPSQADKSIRALAADSSLSGKLGAKRGNSLAASLLAAGSPACNNITL